MKVVFLGTPEFAIKSLEKLHFNSKHKVVAVVTQPDKPNGRGKKIEPSPVKEFALKHEIPLYQFNKISRDGIETLKKLKADIFVTVAYGQILSEQVISIPKYGVVNVHASLLPKYRGASPIQSAVINGEKQTGITIMQTDIGLDTGDILKQAKVDIGEYETAGELSYRLSALGAEMLNSTLDEIENGIVYPIKQIQTDASFTRKIEKTDCYINWNKTAKQIKNLIYGVNPEPIASTVINGEILKVYTAKISNIVADANKENGEILPESSAKAGVFVKTGNGVLELLDVQLPGKKILEAKQLISGRKIKVGDVFEYLLTQNI